MSNNDEKGFNSEIQPRPSTYLQGARPESIPTANLLNPNSSHSISSIMKNDSEIMKTYDLNEENLRNLRMLSKFLFCNWSGTNKCS